VELGRKRAAFAKQGLNIASVSYDSVAVLKAFGDRVGIPYPMLSDPDSRIIRDFGIFHERTEAATLFYGIPYPGTYIVDAQGVVRHKFFEPDYRERSTAGSILLKTSSEAGPEGWRAIETEHLKLRYKASDEMAYGGSRVTLLLDISLKPNMHVYAPGVRGGYIPVDWTISPGAWRTWGAQWPAPRTLRLEAIQETVPVYTGTLTASRDVTFAEEKELFSAAGSFRTVLVEGVFRYQACDEKECFRPVILPLRWTFPVGAHDRVRAPEALQRR
jgi:hypothetical protein